jgi:hypothetical protein
MARAECRSCRGSFDFNDLYEGQCVQCVKDETGLILRDRGARWQEIPKTITVFHTPRSTRSRFVIVYGEENWPVRSLAAKGLENAEVVYRRPATLIEKQEQLDAYRYLAYRAKKWGDVVRDEAKFGVDANALGAPFLRRNQAMEGDSSGMPIE